MKHDNTVSITPLKRFFVMASKCTTLVLELK